MVVIWAYFLRKYCVGRLAEGENLIFRAELEAGRGDGRRAAAGGEPGGAAGRSGGRSATTIKDCVDTALLRCNDTDNRLSLHYVGLIPFRRWWICAGGGAAGEAGGDGWQGDTPLFTLMAGTIRGFGLQKFFFEFRVRPPASVGYNRCVRCCAT